MKKLMFGLALALSATCLADAIESNIVGYQNYTVVKGYNVFTPIFQNTDTANAKLSIQNLKLIGADDGQLLYVLNSKGNFESIYYWFNEFVDGDTTYSEGWFSDNMGNNLATRDIEMGEAFYINAKGDATLQTSGGVKLGEFNKTLSAGYNMIGNATPYSIDIQKLKLIGAQDGDLLYIVNSKGNFESIYYWFNEFVDGDTTYSEGWFSDNMGNNLATRQIDPGAGVYLNVRGSSISYKITQ